MDSQNKKILYKSKSVFAGMVIVGWGFAIVCAFAHNFYGSLFFGCIALYTIYPFLNPRLKVVWIGSKEFEEIMHEEAEKNYNDDGIFTYIENGFRVLLEKDEEEVKWDEIESLVAYKMDNGTTDKICMDVFCNTSNAYRFTEDMKGWHNFNKKLLQQFPQINPVWEMQITTPAFETNYTLLYDRLGRTLDEVKATKYVERK